MRPESVPLLVVALLLVSTQPGVETLTTVVGGTQDIETGPDAVIVLDGTATVPEDATVDASVYVLDGTLDVQGTVDGRVMQFAGDLRAGPSAVVTGTVEVVGGAQSVAEGAQIPVEVVAEPLTQRRSPADAAGLFLMQALALGAVAFLLGRRYPDLLANVAHALGHHPAVSGTVGLLATVTMLALFVFMAFTIVLIPVSVLGLLGGALLALYAYVAVGYLLGRRLRPEDPGVATAAGSVLFLLLSDLLRFVPYVGGLVPLVVVLAGIGAVLVTYLGLRRFEPPTLAAPE